MNGDRDGGEAQGDMSEPKRRFFSGDTLQQALVQAANHFRLQPEEVAYQTIDKRHGFTKVRRKVLIEVDPEAPRRPAGAVGGPAPRPTAGAPAAAGPAAGGAPVRAPHASAPAPPMPPAGDEQAEPPYGWRSDAAPGAHPGRDAGGGGSRSAGGEAESGAPRSVADVTPLRGERPGDAPLGARRRETHDAHEASGASARQDHGGLGGRRREASRGGHGAHRGGGDRGDRRGGERGGDRGRPRWPSGAFPRERPAALGSDAGGEAASGEDLVALPEKPRSVAERYPQAEGTQAEAAARGVELLLRIAGLDLTPRIYRGEERLEIDLLGGDTDWCFADDGELLMAIEHLLPRIIRSLSGEAVLCRVDCDNFHEIREERLRSLAQKVADEVRQRGRARTLVPMNPADRRIIHVTLADDPAVVTESEGDGYFKRVTVRPV
jgi:predicted RNA-binding protein Jag